VRRVDWHDDRGQVAGVEAVPFGVLLFVVGALLVANAWAVVDAKMAVTSAAREAARTFVEANDVDTARTEAVAAARDAIAAYGRDPGRLGLTGGEEPDALARCHAVTFTASYRVPAISLPLIGSFGDGFVVHASHTEVVDPFRDRAGDDAGEARCGT
jgi:Flp pilus assembly protein TadG